MTEAENMALLERVNAAGRIYIIGSELHSDDETREPVATPPPEKMPPQCGVQLMRLPLEHSDSTGHAQQHSTGTGASTCALPCARERVRR